MRGDEVNSRGMKWKDWWIPLLVVGGVFIYLFAYFPYNFGYFNKARSILAYLWHMWENTESAEHGKFVPLICAFFIYTKRKRLALLPISGSNRWGVPLLVLAMMAYFIGYAIDVTYFSYFTLHLFIIAIVLLFFGEAWFRELIFPLSFLLFAWPYNFLEASVTVPLRHFVSGSACLLLNVFGIPVVKVGTGLISAADPSIGVTEGQRFRLDVADPCSGMRSLFSLLMFSTLYAYWILEKNWQRWSIVVWAVPMAVAGNIVRILLLTVGVLIFGSDVAIGTLEKPSLYHTGAGIAVFAVALGGIILLGYILENYSSRLVPQYRYVLSEFAKLMVKKQDNDATTKGRDSY